MPLTAETMGKAIQGTEQGWRPEWARADWLLVTGPEPLGGGGVESGVSFSTAASYSRPSSEPRETTFGVPVCRAPLLEVDAVTSRMRVFSRWKHRSTRIESSGLRSGLGNGAGPTGDI